MTTRFAVLVDGDNIGAQHAARIRQIALARGTPDIWRVYADATRRTTWDDTPGFRLVHAGTGKNAADVLLAIDAMELALRDGISGFLIATSDGDFSHVAQRLRETARCVIGVGEGKTPAAFRASCSDFECLGTGAPPQSASELDRKIRTMIAQHSQKGEGMRIAELAPKMHSSHGIRISALPEKTWRGYLSKRKGLYDLDPKGPEAKVRFRPAGFSAS